MSGELDELGELRLSGFWFTWTTSSDSKEYFSGLGLLISKIVEFYSCKMDCNTSQLDGKIVTHAALRSLQAFLGKCQ